MRERETEPRVVWCSTVYVWCSTVCAAGAARGVFLLAINVSCVNLNLLYLKDLHALSKGQSTFQCPGCLQW